MRSTSRTPRVSSEPTPVFSFDDESDAALRNVKASRYRSLSFLPSERPNRPNIILGELGASLSGAAIGSAMHNPVRLIFARGSPAQMMRIDTATGSIAATMRGFMLRGWWWPINFGADDPCDYTSSPLPPVHGGVTVLAFHVGPNQAVIARVEQRNIANEARRRAVARIRAVHILASGRSLVMEHAVATSVVRLAAVFVGAYSLGSHISNLVRSCVVRARLVLAHFGGLAHIRSSAAVAQ